MNNRPTVYKTKSKFAIQAGLLYESKNPNGFITRGKTAKLAYLRNMSSWRNMDRD